MFVENSVSEPNKVLSTIKMLYPQKHIVRADVEPVLLLIERHVLALQDPIQHFPAHFCPDWRYKKTDEPEIESAINQFTKFIQS